MVLTMLATLLKRAGPALREPRAHAYTYTHLRQSLSQPSRNVQTLAQNKSIYVHPLSTAGKTTYALSYLPSAPSDSPPAAILGHTTAIPPTGDTFTENPPFRTLLLSILRDYAAHDPNIRAEAYASWSASMRRGISGGSPSASERHVRGGGGTGVGGFHNIVDGRVAGNVGMRGVPEPQDVLGSVGVDGNGEVVGGPGGFVECESWRVVTGDGVGVLTEYLEGKLVERLKEQGKK
ncbi:hypothetical protein Dda_8191 [Drechslerella dactyloides]|uniref:Uncharacterized protein n=1 Tax=Drechslerella dactyloides TaxID=74499 RepID=A0AAD6NGH0_DREDA|nr:hypothetical protein Dda_8191 [Drechslerella dactyloides]